MSSPSIVAPLKALGPGLVVAAAGIGAGDVITATVTGAQFGTELAWALMACVVLKLVLNEGVARWQLATGSTLIEACVQRLPRWVSVYFLVYLLLWTFLVGESLTNACGLAGHSLFPQWPVWAWGIAHSVVATTLVLLGKFGLFEHLMKVLVGVMVITVLICAVLVKPQVGDLLRHLAWPMLPPDSGRAVLGIFGGIGGSMTMLCYGYWIRENKWHGASHQRAVRADLLLAYAVTLIFAVALTIVAAGCNAAVTQGSGMALEVAARLEATLGPAGRWAFLIGFWCAVFTAMLAVWQGVPYLFADFMAQRSRQPHQLVAALDLKKTVAYRSYLLFLAGPPLVLLFAEKPVAMVVLFTVIGGFFMPFLAALLLYLNNRRDWVGPLRNGVVGNGTLVVALLLFGWIAATELIDLLFEMNSGLIIGGGIVGLATALKLLECHPAARLILLEKEAGVARHQSTHNSGVLHCGLYYKPGSLKAKLAVEGIREMTAFCRARDIPHEICGKLVVATRPEELPRLDELLRRGAANGLTGLRRIDRDAIRRIEPHAAGVAAAQVPQEGIVDYRAVCAAMAIEIQRRGGIIQTSARVTNLHRQGGEWIAQTSTGEARGQWLINTAGLHCDRVSKLAGEQRQVRIVPFRGEYYQLRDDARHLCRHLIYPVPDPSFPFLGVHFTRRIGGEVEAGPNAVLAFAREGYRLTQINLRDLADTLAFPGFWRFLKRYPSMAGTELAQSFSRRRFCQALQRLVPEVQPQHLTPGGAGVRAQAMTPQGELVQDFHILARDHALHILNAPSPAATASLAIGAHIAAAVA